MLVELAIGDAYGAGFEYAPGAFVRAHNNPAGYVQHPRHGIRPGCYTDDTQMSLALAEVIVEERPWTREVLAEHFVYAFKRDPREGYAGRFYAFLQEVRDGADFLARIRPYSDKSGAAMRAAPVGIFPSISEVTERSRVQAALTHNTDAGLDAAMAVALMAHYFVYDLGPKADLGVFLENHVPGRWTGLRPGRVGAKGLESAAAAAALIPRHDSLRALLQDCVALTGDVDTVAAMALACAACSREYRHDLPAILYEKLENGAFGREHLAELDRRLRARINS